MNPIPLFSDYSFPLPDLQGRHIVLPNGINLTAFADTDSEVVRLEFIFANAGSNNQRKFFTSAAAANLLTEGSDDMTGAQMADRLDYFGAYVEKSTNRESSYIAFYFLKKYSPDLLPLIELMIKQPLYGEKEFRVYISRQRQAYELEQQKTSTIAYKEFYKRILDSSNPVSKFGKLEDYDLITPNDVRDFYNSFYSSSECEIVLAGNYPEELLREVENRFGAASWGLARNRTANGFSKTPFGEIKTAFQSSETAFGFTVSSNYDNQTHNTDSETAFINKNGAVQASLRVGRQTISYNCGDFLPFKVLVALYGGYFGSRLMTNIREEKGYTYSIGSYISTYRNCAVLTTLADVKAEAAKETLKEIDFEAMKLQNDLVPQEELTILKNYLMGECLRGLDGVFDLAEKFSIVRRSGYKATYFEDMMKAIREATPESLRTLAQKYLRPETMCRVVVGDNELTKG